MSWNMADVGKNFFLEEATIRAMSPRKIKSLTNQDIVRVDTVDAPWIESTYRE